MCLGYVNNLPTSPSDVWNFELSVIYPALSGMWFNATCFPPEDVIHTSGSDCDKAPLYRKMIYVSAIKEHFQSGKLTEESSTV